MDINFKAIYNALESEILLKRHLFIKIISLSPQNLYQYDKNLNETSSKNQHSN